MKGGISMGIRANNRQRMIEIRRMKRSEGKKGTERKGGKRRDERVNNWKNGWEER